jgi:isoquinoline 1-oxidoreductase subunit beta
MVLIGGTTAAGALLVGYGLWPSDRRSGMNLRAGKSDARFVSDWIKIADDDTITVVIPHCDMGTGIFTALSQMAAEELDADWGKVRAEAAPADLLFANWALVEGYLLDEANMTRDSIPAFLQGAVTNAGARIARYLGLQTTGGSSAVSNTGVYGMRVAAAAARGLLIEAAAARMSAPVRAFHTEMSRVVHAPSGTSFSFGELAGAAARYKPSSHPKLKSRSDYQLVGKPIPRLDIPDKVNGAARYGIDMQLPGMRYAAISISPAFGGKLVSVNEAPVAQDPRVQKVVRLEDAVVVVADRFWRARKALDSLEPAFDPGKNAQVSSSTIRDDQLAALKTGKIKRDLTMGAGAEALRSGPVIERVYNVPYLAHAAMEPVNATALYNKEGTLEVWAGTQDGLGSRAYCARVAGVRLKDVTFHLLPSGGSFGRRLPDLWNFLAYAVRTAMALPGVPIKLIFTREQDMQHDFYRPSVTSRFKASLGQDGTPAAWVNDYTTVDEANSEAHILYNVPNQAYGAVKVASPVPTGPWRSVESSWHGYCVESFIDELAHLAHRDPLDYRRSLLKGKPRHVATLDLAAEKAGWGTPLSPRRGRGIALVECFGTIVAHVAEIEVTDDGVVRVHRITSAADCGTAVNPDGFKAQIEGAIVFGLSAALYGEITIAHGAAVQQNFPDYPVVRLADCPAIDVHIHESDAPLGGGGEPGTPPVAPALANAIFAATGVRIRELPIIKHGPIAGPVGSG